LIGLVAANNSGILLKQCQRPIT